MKKLSLLLASIGAGLLLVGGTVAAYIVSSADTLGVRVSPGTVTADTTGRITLKWGENSLVHVGNLEVGTPTQVGTIKLAAESEIDGLASTYQGRFSVKFQNLTAHSSATDLMDKLTINVYEDRQGDGAHYGAAVPLPAATVVGGYEETSTSFVAKAGYLYKVEVTLGTIELEPGTPAYETFLSQVAYASFNWGPGEGDIDTKDLATVYFAVGDSEHVDGTDIYAHVYNGNKVAAPYPGLKMTYEYDIAGSKHLYSASFDKSKYNTFRFFKKVGSAEPAALTESAVTKTFAEDEGAPYYNGTAWASKPLEVLSSIYYLRGKIGEDNYWNENIRTLGFTQDGTTASQYNLLNVKLNANDEIRVYKPGNDGGTWFGPSNWVINQTGLYNIHIDETKGDGDGWTNKMIVVNVSFKAKVGTRDDIQLLDNFGATSGADAEYVGTVTATTGEALVIKNYYTQEPSPVTYTVDGESLDVNKQFKANGTYNVYLKLIESNYHVYVGLVS